MRVLLTGAAGYLGQHVLRELLARGHEVTAAARDPARLVPHARVRPCRLDLEDAAAVARIAPGHDALVHAALVWGPEGREPLDTEAAARLFAAAGDVARAVYVSSVAVHRPFAAVMSEEDALVPVEPYAVAKAAGEAALRASFGPRGVAIRPGPIVGPPAVPGGALRTDRRLLAMVEAAREGRPIEVPGDARQWSAADAVARAVAALLTAVAPHPVYVCVDRAAIPWARIAEWVIAATGSRSALRIAAPTGPAPRFRTERVEALLGGPTSAEEALRSHLACLAI